MNLRDICHTAMKKHHLSQNQLAERIGLHKGDLSAAIHRRRDLPADAAIELAELAEMPAKVVRDAGKRNGGAISKGVAHAIRVCILIVGLPVITGGYADPFTDSSRYQKWLRWLNRKGYSPSYG